MKCETISRNTASAHTLPHIPFRSSSSRPDRSPPEPPSSLARCLLHTFLLLIFRATNRRT
eukprot:9499512-Pyramimonas_sp.AAC.1